MAEQSTEPKVDTEGQAPATAEPAAEAPVKEPEAAAEKPGEDQVEEEAKSILEESEEDKDGEPEKPKAPEDYEFEYPEGVQVDEGALAEFKPLAKELGLSQENLAKIVGVTGQAVAIWEKTDKVPLVNDRYLRGLYLEAKTGEADLMAAIDSINDLDHELHKLNLEFEGEWHSKDCA